VSRSIMNSACQTVGLAFWVILLAGCAKEPTLSTPVDYTKLKPWKTLKLADKGDTVSSVVFSSDGTKVFAGYHWSRGNQQGGGLAIWDLQSEVLHTQPGTSTYMHGISYAAADDLLVTPGTMKGGQNVPVLHDALYLADPKGEPNRFVLMEGMPADADHFSVSPDGRKLAATLHNGQVAIWSIYRAGGKPTARRPTLADGPYQDSPLYSHDGSRLLCKTRDGKVRVLHGSTARAIREYSVPDDSGLAFAPDGKSFALTCGNPAIKEQYGTIRITEVDTGDAISFEGPHKDRVGKPAGIRLYSPDGRTLVLASEPDEISFCDSASGKEIHTIQAQSIGELAFSTDGKMLAWSNGSEVVIWRVETADE
jgi:WD40 repeat protein